MEAIKKIETAKPSLEVRVCCAAKLGTVLHQGDVYLHRVSDDHPRGKALGTRQVAVGTTVGSRHVVEGDVQVFEGTQLPKGVEEPEWCAPGSLLGPVVVAKSTATLTHPEHAHHRFPAGVWQVTYQADYSTQRRVAD